MAYLLLVFTVLFWVGNSVLARAIHLEFPPVTLAFTRWSLALVLILPFLIPRLRRDWPIIRAHWKIILLLGILGVACFNTLIYTGLQTTLATNATLLHSAIPVVILIISRVFLKQAVGARQWLGVGISMTGVLVLLTQARLEALLQLEFNRGDLWVLAGVIDWALYSVLLRYRPLELGAFTFFGITVLIGATALLLPALIELYSGHMPQVTSRTLGTVLYMAVFPSILSYLCWNRGVAELGAPVAGLFIHLMPLFGLLLSVLILGERVQSFHFAGIALIFVGIYLAVVSQTLRSIKPVEPPCKN
ncbi:multidrug DMT transporter permease [Marinobacterium nitratireducens]|uniref:Multidrug DMT transporter permease n=1 Tax=Marinobacterium nitratireducens TaxID=518897 RepID=A0A917ZG51_9GAMM|nr:DMT family transporter [Marinobacterium nitratireducens]GGO82760.1 multidrug DMT transporter permease [Marinobacterium nitratireducens]